MRQDPRLRGDPRQARTLLEAALPVFRQAGDFRCTARTLAELAAAADPAAARAQMLQCLHAAAVAPDPILHAEILARLITVGVAAGDLALAARCQGALTALTALTAPRAPAAPRAPRETHPALRDPAYATFVNEGRIGGIGLLASLYPAQ